MKSLIILLVFAGVSHGQAVARWGGRFYSAPVCSSGNCSMCNSIRYQLAQSVELSPSVPATPEPKEVSVPEAPTMDLEELKPIPQPKKEDPGQAPLGNDEITDALASLRLIPGDVFCDVGCGDGRILITAVRRYRCRAVGIEIDHKKANEARINVAKAENEGIIQPGYITIYTGDAKQFDPQKYGVTAAIAYLFPETLEQIKSTLQRIPRLAIPFHEIEDFNLVEKHRNNFVYINGINDRRQIFSGIAGN